MMLAMTQRVDRMFNFLMCSLRKVFFCALIVVVFSYRHLWPVVDSSPLFLCFFVSKSF